MKSNGKQFLTEQITKDKNFVKTLVSECKGSSNLENFLNECLSVGRIEAQRMLLLTEQQQEFGFANSPSVQKQASIPMSKGQGAPPIISKEFPLDTTVLSILKKYDPSIQIPQQQQNPQQAKQNQAQLGQLVGNMLTKLEGTASKFVGKLKPEELKKTLNSTLQQMKPVLKPEDSANVDTIKKYFEFLVQKNPRYASVIVGILVNAAKASVAAAGAPAVGALGAGVVVGMVLRTIVGRMKNPKEDWKTAAANAAKVTAISLLSGMAIKGIFSMFSGQGFLSGVKSYLGGGSPASSAASAEVGPKMSGEQMKGFLDQLGSNPGRPSTEVFRNAVGNDAYNKVIKALAISPSTRAEQAAEQKLKIFLDMHNANPNSHASEQLADILNRKGVSINLGSSPQPNQK